MTRGESKNHWVALQVEPLRGPSQTNQPKKHEPRRECGYLKESAAGSHADRRFYKDRRGSGHANPAARLFQNGSSTQEADALHDVGSDARATGVSEQAGEFCGENREQRGGQANKTAGPDACGAAAQFALDADDGAQHSGHCQPQKDFTKGEHDSGAPARLWEILIELQFELRQFRKVACSGVYLAALEVPQAV